MLFRVLQIFVAAFLCAGMVLLLHFIAHGDLDKPSAPLVEYKDFVTILLACLGVMIAVATIFAAFGAIWGFDLLRRETQASAERVAREHAEKIAQSRVEAMLPGLVKDAVRFEMQGNQQNLDTRADQIAEEISKDNTNG